MASRIYIRPRPQAYLLAGLSDPPVDARTFERALRFGVEAIKGEAVRRNVERTAREAGIALPADEGDDA